MYFRANKREDFHELDFCRFDAFGWRSSRRRPFTQVGGVVLLRWARGVALPDRVRPWRGTHMGAVMLRLLLGRH